MLFKRQTLEGIREGHIHTAFRKWVRPTVKEGGTLLTPAGQLKILAVEPIDWEKISDDDIKSAGVSTRDELEKLLSSRPDGQLYKIVFERIGPDPRIALRELTDLSTADIEDLTRRLGRFDKSSRFGPWTNKVLHLIDDNPATRAQSLADFMEIEKDVLKVNIRKLKKLGLTESLPIGYRLSPRGKAFLQSLEKSQEDDPG